MVAASLSGFVIEELEYVADREPCSDRRIVQSPHDLDVLALPLPDFCLALCSARNARYDLPLKR